MPRLTSKWDLWFALTGELQLEACLLWGRHVGASLPSPTFPEGGSRLAEGTVLSLDPLRVSLARMSQPLRTVFTFFPYQEKLVISHIIRGHEKVKKNYLYP